MFRNVEEPVYPISVAAKLLNISIHTLRMYEKEGLILPFKKETRHRLYSRSDIERLVCIRGAINEKKISIAGIKSLYALIPCWEITGCSETDQKNCEAIKNYSSPCWAFKHRENMCENLKCRECSVYKEFSDCGKIKASIIQISRDK